LGTGDPPGGNLGADTVLLSRAMNRPVEWEASRMTIRRSCWTVAAAVALIVILGAAAFCLAFGGWRRITQFWVAHMLKSSGAEVYVVGNSWDEGPWSLFPARRYRVVFSGVRPNLQLTSRLGRVSDLSLENVQLGANDCAELGNLATLETLELAHVVVPLDGWERMGKLRSLVSIIIVDVKVGEPGAVWLARLPSLVYLWGDGARFPSSQPLAGDIFPRLQQATFVNCELGTEFLAALSHAPLEQLDLLNSRFPENALNRLSGLTKLRSLGLVADISGERVSSFLQSLRSLSTVWVVVDSDGDAICRSLEGLPYLMEVQIKVKGNGKVGDMGLKHLAKAQGLRKLAVISAEEVTNAGVADLAGCRNLRSVTLHNSQITDEGLGVLAQLPELYELDITGSRISDDGLRVLMRSKSLRVLDVSQTQVTDRGLGYIRDWRGLEVLEIRGARVSLASLAELKRQRPDLAVVMDDD